MIFTKTIKIIDLLNKIANGEEVPKKIKHHWEYEYKFDELRNEYCYMDNKNRRFDEEWLVMSMIKDEVEIIEEEKDMEKLNKYNFHKKQRQLASKINELIEAVNELKKEEK